MLYPINEIFYSIQGEGYHVGRPVVFIRLAGCNLNCEWCDTDHSKKWMMTEDGIVARVMDLWPAPDFPSVILTGGEPLIHNLEPLIKKLCQKKAWIGIETNGTRSMDYLSPDLPLPPYIDWMALSPKKIDEVTLQMVRAASEIKIVFESEEKIKQYETRLELINFQYQDRLYIQPCSEDYQPAVDFVLKNPQWRLSVQIQKVIGVS